MSLDRPRRILLPLLVALTLTPTLAHAQSEADRERAAEFYQNGLKAAYAKDYGEAILQFKQGYKLDSNGLFAYNIAVANLKVGKPEEARRYARQAEARADDLNDKQRTRNLARIDAVGAILGAQQVAQRVASAPDPAPIQTTSRASGEREGLGAIGWSGLGMTIVGAGMVGASTLFANRVGQLQEPDGTFAPENYDQAVRAQSTGLTLLISGGVIAVVGAGMFIYALGSRSGGAEEAATLQIAPTRGGGYMGLHLRF